MQTQIDGTSLKRLLKEALMEALEGKKGVVHDLIVEALEDIALVRAIQDGEHTETIGKQEVFDILEGGREFRIQIEFRQGPEKKKMGWD